MIKQFFKIGGVKTEKEFLAKYPTEASFFRQHPEAMALIEQSMPYMPSYSDMIIPQAMYGMAYGGSFIPRAQYGIQVSGAPPVQEDYPDYESFIQAYDEYLASLQQQANMSQAMPQGLRTGLPVPESSPYVPTNNFNLKDYSGVSIVDFLSTQGIPANFSSRKEIASILGITNYRGTASQNKEMIAMIQQNPNIFADYKGITQPTGDLRKTAAKTRNSKGIPSTEEIVAAKHQAQGTPNYITLPEVEVYAKKYKSLPDVNVFSRKKSPIENQNFLLNVPGGKIRRSIVTGAWEAVPDPNGTMTIEMINRIKLANERNAFEAAERSGQPVIRQGRKEKGGEWNGTWNGNQGFAAGGTYLPDYASSAYGLPQFELGAPIYADGGMSPEEAMMMQQQGAGAASPDQGAGIDQQQIVQAVMQMMQQGMDPNEIMQQLVQGGVPPEIAEQIIMTIIQQVQGDGGQGGMGGGQPNGMQQPMAPPSPEQGMEGMPMPGGMAKGGMVPGWEGEVSMAQLEDLKRKGIKFDII